MNEGKSENDKNERFRQSEPEDMIDTGQKILRNQNSYKSYKGISDERIKKNFSEMMRDKEKYKRYKEAVAKNRGISGERIEKRLSEMVRDREKYKRYKEAVAKNKKTEMVEDLGKERKKLENKDLKQDILLKKISLAILFLFLVAETIVIFYFAWCQAIRGTLIPLEGETGLYLINFHLEEWSFRLLTGVTITQITAMLLIAISYLFKERNNNNKDKSKK